MVSEDNYKPEKCAYCGNTKGNIKVRDFNGVWILDQCSSCGAWY